jgi:hypothetical protein
VTEQTAAVANDVGQQQVPAFHVTVGQNGRAYNNIGNQYNYNGRERVHEVPISRRDQLASADDRFVQPDGEWPLVMPKLQDHSGLIILGDRGTGRRTASLHILSKCAGEQLFELRPTWSRPAVELLPAARQAAGYLLDLSEPMDEEVPDDFASDLLAWANQGKALVVALTTDDDWARRWTKSARGATIRLGSPDARRLAASVLRLKGAGHLLNILADKALTPIWESSPRAEDACRLAERIAENFNIDLTEIVDEYRGWRDWIDTEIPDDLGPRTLMWSSAFCDGGTRKSILAMSEALRVKLGEHRTPAAILADRPPSKRLKDAQVELKGDGYVLAPTKHGLPAALRRDFWDEFEGQRPLLREWIVSQLKVLPPEDAARVARSILDIVMHTCDGGLLDTLRDELAVSQPRIAAEVIETAVLDRHFGAQARQRIYGWVKKGASPTSGTIDLVARICGGRFGMEKPDQALTRLGWAAQRSGPGNEAVTSAVTAIAGLYPEGILRRVNSWFGDPNLSIAGTNAFMALASTEKGAALLCREPDPVEGSPGVKEKLTSYFCHAIAEEGNRETVHTILASWAEQATSGALDQEMLAKVFAAVLISEGVASVLLPFVTENRVRGDFWSEVINQAFQRPRPAAEIRPEQAAPVEQVDAVVPGAGIQSAPVMTEVRDAMGESKHSVAAAQPWQPAPEVQQVVADITNEPRQGD